MTRYDQKILFTALAFVAVFLKDGESIQLGREQKIKLLANLLDDFCMENVSLSFSESAVDPARDADVESSDAAIERHIEELIQKKSRVLPLDRASLHELYERLQLRKVRRINAVLFETISDQQLAHFVLSQLDEEIEERGAAS